MSLSGAAELRRLLDSVLATPGVALVIEGLTNGEGLTSDDPIPVTIEASIDRHRRMVYGSKDFRESGLFELRLGLLFMDSHRFDLAVEQFEEASQQWQFADDPYLMALADLGAGLSCHAAYDYERAMAHYQSVDRWLARVANRPAAYKWAGRKNERDEYLEGLHSLLNEAKAGTRQSLKQLSRRSIKQGPVASPVIDEQLTEAEQRPSVGGVFCLSFAVPRPTPIASLQKQVASALATIDQIDRVLSAALGKNRTPGLAVQDLQLGSSLDVWLGYHQPATPRFCRALLAANGHLDSSPPPASQAHGGSGANEGEQAWIEWTTARLVAALGAEATSSARMLAVLLVPYVRQLLAILAQVDITIVDSSDR